MSAVEYPDFSVEEMLKLWADGSYDDCRKRRQIINCDMHGWEYAEEGDYEQDDKYQYATYVIRHIASGRCFMVNSARSGSPFSDWYYSFDGNPVEVTPVEKVIKITEWQPV